MKDEARINLQCFATIFPKIQHFFKIRESTDGYNFKVFVSLLQAILPDFSDFDLSNESIKLAIINHIEKAAKKRVTTVLQSIENWESYFLNFFERDEDMLNELVENLFYRTGLVESSFKIINTRIVEENLYICYGKETPCGILKKEDYAASTLEKLNKIIQTCRYQTEKEFLEIKVKEVDLKSKFEEIKKDKVFLKEVDKIIKIKKLKLQILIKHSIQ